MNEDENKIKQELTVIIIKELKLNPIDDDIDNYILATELEQRYKEYIFNKSKLI